MDASDVDRLGYGDWQITRRLFGGSRCASYNTILYGDSYKKDIESDFVSMQGNHMILAIPYGVITFG
jgi:hypothetical protein